MILAKRTWQMFASVAGACVVGYFLYHTVEGDRGWFAQVRLQNQVNAARDTLTSVTKEHDALEHRVHLMRPESLDPDLLDEESRKTLNYSKPNEIIILTPQDQSAGPPKK
jgi:cell division protein FtsB